MTNSLKSILSGFAAVTLLASAQCEAAQIKITDGPGSGPGGEFLVTALDPSLAYLDDAYSSAATLNGGFFSFCIQKTESITLPGTYYAEVSPGALGHTIVGTDIISNGTAWLYKHFALGQLDYDYYGAGREADANMLQSAIWFLEGEGGSVAGNLYYLAALAEFGGTVTADNNGSFGVKALNLGSSLGTYGNQDQLVYVPDNGWTVALLGLGMLSLIAIRRQTAKA